MVARPDIQVSACLPNSLFSTAAQPEARVAHFAKMPGGVIRARHGNGRREYQA
jgi:hypothetical protein